MRAAGWHVWPMDAEMSATRRRNDALWPVVASGGARRLRPTRRAPTCMARHLSVISSGKHDGRGFLGIWLPLACLAVGLIFGPWGWVVWMNLSDSLLQKLVRESGPLKVRARLALFYVLASFPQAWGAILFSSRDRLLGRQAHISIEYK